MELKEYLKIIKQNSKLFWSITLLIIAGSFAYFIFKPVSFGTSLTLNITRKGSQETPDYKFGDFYRLQADEKFAETVVEWLKSPRTVADIYSEAGINPNEFSLKQLTKSLKPEKLSSQIVAVNFSAANPESAGKISKSIFEIISRNTENLNKNQNEKTWFEVLAQDPVILKEKFDPFVVLVISLAAGIFAAFWVVLVAHYLK
jgi:capsular polysaccharide biosynthesis protein